MRFENLSKLINVEEVSKLGKTRKVLEKFRKTVNEEDNYKEYDIFFLNYFCSNDLLKYQNYFRIFKEEVKVEDISSLKGIEDCVMLCNNETVENYPGLADLGALIVNDLKTNNVVFLNRKDFTFKYKEFTSSKEEDGLFKINFEFEISPYKGYLKSSLIKLK